MGHNTNIKLYLSTKKFYLDNINKYKTPSAFAHAYRKFVDNSKTDQTLRKVYFGRFIKGEGLEETELNEIIPNSPSVIENERIVEETGTTKIIQQKTEKRITSLQEAIDFFEVDLTEWEVDHWKCKSWDTAMKVDDIVNGLVVTKPITKTNYLVNIHLKKRINEINYNKIQDHLDNFIKEIPTIKRKGSRTGVLTIADLHTGLNVKQFTEHTQEFNIKKLLQYLEETSYIINSYNYEKVYLNILGDLVESVTGHNKIETLKEMEQGIYGGSLIITAYEILHKFIKSINNVVEVNMISGNHDRLTPDRAMDKDGGAAQLVAYMLSKDTKINWHPLILKRIIDEICYILTHGDHKLVKQDVGKLIFEYGEQNMYNVILSGHWHTRKSVKIFNEKNLILADTSKYRAITVSPIVTGNRWTEENGWSCSPGVTITEASSDKKNINHFDLALSR
jgi:hypothetical protein